MGVILDLFCGAGGACAGYQRAGYDVIGVDISPQKHYPGVFRLADALAVVGEYGWVDAVHASPPCQHYAAVTSWRGNQADHPDLVDATRDALVALGRPWIIENVPEAPLRNPTILCGSHFGLPVRRHRAFETSFLLDAPPACCHRPTDLAFMHKGERAYADAMECNWMTSHEGREAIPPAYTEWIGRQIPWA